MSNNLIEYAKSLWQDNDGDSAMQMLVDYLRTKDIAEVVRCKDCIHYDLRWGKCNHADLQESMRFRPHRDKDDFCKRGEMKIE